VKLDYSAHYARYHPDNPRHRRGLTLLHERILKPLLPVERNARILDVGCAAGFMLHDVRGLGYQNVSGFEPDEKLAAIGRANGLEISSGISTTEFLAKHVCAFDVILLMDVLEHMPKGEQIDLLAAIYRSLKPGGRIICSVPNAGAAIASFWRYNDYTHHDAFTADALSFVLEQAGFQGVRCDGPEFFPRPRFTFWIPTARSVAWWLRCWVRLRQRATYIAELGWDRGRTVILTPNLLAVAEKRQ
jgi:2-polyprenyl-3-methyl-5-hydroxy-6-metoxy-1,4-benzoquinol methylase